MTKELKETIYSIMKWHEETFPDATLEGQLDKYQEEQEEWAESKFKDLDELADMFVVACGIARFDMYEGIWALNDVFDWMYVYNMKKVIKAIDKKMKKNRKRVWKKTSDGQFHHV